MTLLAGRSITKSFGSRLILDGADLVIEPQARIGVVGPNGGGKSTLMKVLAGLETPDGGVVSRRRGVRVAYLDQHPVGDDRTALQTVVAARPDLAALEHELAELAAQLGSAEVIADLGRMTRVLARQEETLERFEAAGGPGAEGRARAALLEIGLSTDELPLPTHALSGGQRKLIALTACLEQQPDVLLLDEPEAHLDNEGRARVEQLARRFEGAIVAVSHDRYLLDEIVDQIASLEGGRIRLWAGNYSAYTLERELELQRQQQAYVTQQKEIERLEAAIARFKLWASWVPDKRNIRQANNKQRQIDRMDTVDRPALERRKIALQLRPATRGGKRVFDLRSVDVAFGADPVLSGVDLDVVHGERVGIVGRNGAGKSVLLKTIVGEISPTSGEVRIGPSIAIGYLAQEQDTLDPASTPLDTVRRAAPVSDADAVSLLMKFLFPYEQVRRENRLLSGGERTRLQLLLLMMARPNLLVLDEPTNHLDIESVEVLEAAIEEFSGTVVAISHDRYFLDRVADRIVEVDGGVTVTEGGYSAWIDRKAARGSELTIDDADSNDWLSATTGADAETQMVVLCLLAGRGVTLDDEDLRGALRRAELLLAAGGDPRRPLELYGRAVTALAVDLDDPGARAQLASGLSELERELSPPHDLATPLRLLALDADLAWQCYAMALLAEELADEEPSAE